MSASTQRSAAVTTIPVGLQPPNKFLIRRFPLTKDSPRTSDLTLECVKPEGVGLGVPVLVVPVEGGGVMVGAGWYSRILAGKGSKLLEGEDGEGQGREGSAVKIEDSADNNENSELKAKMEEMCEDILNDYKKELENAAKEEEQQQEELDIDYCQICQDGGELLCCEGCPKVWHGACLLKKKLITKKVLDSDEDWFCADCVKERKKKENEKNEKSSQVDDARKEKGLKEREIKSEQDKERFKDVPADPFIRYTSHGVARFFDKENVPQYNYEDREVSDEGVSEVMDTEATTRAFYAVVWPALLKKGWRESEGGCYVSPPTKRLDAKSGLIDVEVARYDSINGLINGGEMSLDLRAKFEYVKLLVEAGGGVAKRKRASSKFLERRRKKANNGNSTNVLFSGPSSPGKPTSPKQVLDEKEMEEKEEGEKEEGEKEEGEKKGEEKKKEEAKEEQTAAAVNVEPPNSQPKKSSRLGSNYQVGPMPKPNGGGDYVDHGRPAECTVTWDPREFNAKWGDCVGEDPIQKFLSSVPSKFQDVAMSAFHLNHYDFPVGKVAALRIIRGETDVLEAPEKEAEGASPKSEDLVSIEEDEDDDDDDERQLSAQNGRNNSMWTAPEREHFHRLIIEHKKNLQNVNRAMPNKNMGDILQYYLASYKSSRNYPQLKVVMTEERERKEREEEAEMLKGDGNDDYCALCDDGGGDLICCEFCPRVYHIDCMVKQEIISPKEAQRLLAGEDGGGGDVRVEMEIEVEGGGC